MWRQLPAQTLRFREAWRHPLTLAELLKALLSWDQQPGKSQPQKLPWPHVWAPFPCKRTKPFLRGTNTGGLGSPTEGPHFPREVGSGKASSTPAWSQWIVSFHTFLNSQLCPYFRIQQIFFFFECSECARHQRVISVVSVTASRVLF